MRKATRCQAALKFSQRNNPYCELVSFAINIEN
jgi:hypothetical protein